MDEPSSIARLCYPGKVVELRHGDESLLAHVASIDSSALRLSENLPSFGACEVAVVFLGERYLGHARLVTDGDGISVLVVHDGLRTINVRSAPRVAVDLAGTYYLRPPTLGVPMRVVDISVSGLAILPVTGHDPAIDEHRMCSFGLGDREIKAVVRFVEITEELWRARFVKLGLSDEEAIASLVLSLQVHQRQRLSPLEIQTVSSLDVEDRLRYPLVEDIRVGESEIIFVANGSEVAVARSMQEPLVPAEITALVGWLRCGDLRDLNLN